MVNEDKNTKLIDALKFEVEELRRQLAEKEGKLGLGPAKPITLIERVEVEVVRDNPELAAQVAALKIQNSFRSKLMARLQSQWRDKLAESAAAAAEREEALKVCVVVSPAPCLMMRARTSFCRLFPFRDWACKRGRVSPLYLSIQAAPVSTLALILTLMASRISSRCTLTHSSLRKSRTSYGKGK